MTLGQDSSLGIFAGHEDVGKPARPGSVQYDAARGAYLVTGGGDNMWSTNDAFHYVWKQVSGNVSLAAEVRWPGSSGNPNAHRKAALILRQSQDSDSPYVDAVVHGNGLTSLQFRETKGGVTAEVQANLGATRRPGPHSNREARRLRHHVRGRRGQTVATDGRGLPPGTQGAVLRRPRRLLSQRRRHRNGRIHQSRTGRAARLCPPRRAERSRSSLEVVPVPPSDRKVAYFTSDHVEAPNWSPDGKFFIFNQGEPALQNADQWRAGTDQYRHR